MGFVDSRCMNPLDTVARPSSSLDETSAIARVGQMNARIGRLVLEHFLHGGTLNDGTTTALYCLAHGLPHDAAINLEDVERWAHAVATREQLTDRSRGAV